MVETYQVPETDYKKYIYIIDALMILTGILLIIKEYYIWGVVLLLMGIPHAEKVAKKLKLVINSFNNKEEHKK